VMGELSGAELTVAAVSRLQMGLPAREAA
jgi:hypothetical protein